MRKRVLIILVIVLIIVIVIKVFDIYSRLMQGMYPMEYSEYVERYAEKYNIEREWIFALIKTESNFKENSVSQSGAVGLMQLMEKTGKEVSKQIRNG